MSSLTLTISDDGNVVAKGDLTRLIQVLGPGGEVACARPNVDTEPLINDPNGTIRVHAIYHNSLVDGPGSRSVLQVQGCPIRCKGCYVPLTHDMYGGVLMTEDQVVRTVLRPNSDIRRDGVTIVGGEPLAQADALRPVVTRLANVGQKILIYTGYPLEHVAKHGTSSQWEMLLRAHAVVDGPYIERLAAGAMEYCGSRNQRYLKRDDVRQIIEGGRDRS